MKQLIKKLRARQNLSHKEMQLAMTSMLTNLNEAQSATLLTLLSIKGETADEIYSVVKAMQAQMIKIDTQHPTLDIVGTGGDGFNTVNISTGSALLAASCGVKIAKHGNRSVSSMTGSADIVEKLGLTLDLSPSQISNCIDLYNFGFIYAPNFHPALAKLKLLRKNMSIPTVFNLVGPLLNPCKPDIMMIGVSNQAYLNIFSDVLIQMNVKRALVFSCQGLDEICQVAPIDMVEVNNGNVNNYKLDPADYGFSYCKVEDLQGRTPIENAKTIQLALNGAINPISDSLILNAGIANYLFGICKTIKEGIALAKDMHCKGRAYALLERLTYETATFDESKVVSHA